MNVFARHSNRRAGWFWRNRWGLGLLPLATVAALAASSDRVKTYWWEADLHDRLAATQGEWFAFSQPYQLDTGEEVMSLRVRLDSIRTMSAQEVAGTQSYTPTELPAGSRAVEVAMSFEVDPATPVGGCAAALRGQDGTRYDYMFTIVGDGEAGSVCAPVETPGPDVSLGKLEMPGPDQQPRPQAYTVKRAYVIPEDAVITEVDLWWGPPRYIAFRAASESAQAQAG